MNKTKVGIDSKENMHKVAKNLESNETLQKIGEVMIKIDELKEKNRKNDELSRDLVKINKKLYYILKAEYEAKNSNIGRGYIN